MREVAKLGHHQVVISSSCDIIKIVISVQVPFKEKNEEST